MIATFTNVTKKYGKKTALDDISLSIGEGQCFGLLGRNGAGKSTFIRLMLGLIFPTSGTVEVFSGPPGRGNQRIGYVSENLTIYPHLNAKDNLRMAAYSADQTLSNKTIDSIIEQLSIEGARRKLAKDFSLGMKRRLQLGMATMVKPIDLAVLDEPTNGLDVNGMLWLRGYISYLIGKGVPVIMASHSLLELQTSITHFVIFNAGRVARQEEWDAASGASLEDVYLATLEEPRE